MNSNIAIENPTRVIIICEGAEECEYIKKLNELDVWSRSYRVRPINAKGINRIPEEYGQAFDADDSGGVIVVFCDTEVPPYKQFEFVCNGINELYGNDKAADSVVFFSNPSTMQIVASHFTAWNDGSSHLRTNKKADNAKLVFKLQKKNAPKNEYKAKGFQISSLYIGITKENFETMRRVIRNLSHDYNIIPSTNVNVLFDNLCQDDKSWIRLIHELFKWS
ncbi:MAG: hypothetical protein LUD50_01940 [Clostridia bacterium]|nr:hypothetical protein [Clostridia bacterium]